MMKRMFYCAVVAFLLCFLFISCSSSPNEESDLTPSFVLTAGEKDAIDVFTASGVTSWDDDCELLMIAKKPGEGAHFKECLRDGYWGKKEEAMAPATLHYCTPKYNGIDDSDSYTEWKGTHFKVQVQCVNEEQGLCCVKFTSQYLKDDRKDYAGKWVFQIGTDLKTIGDDATLENVFYTAYVTIE